MLAPFQISYSGPWDSPGLLRPILKRFRNYCGLIKIARSGFPWEKTTKRSLASVYTNCETAVIGRTHPAPMGVSRSWDGPGNWLQQHWSLLLTLF
jgi:hypothetical protein